MRVCVCVCSGCANVSACSRVHICVFHAYTDVCSSVHTSVLQSDACLCSRRTRVCYQMNTRPCLCFPRAHKSVCSRVQTWRAHMSSDAQNVHLAHTHVFTWNTSVHLEHKHVFIWNTHVRTWNTHMCTREHSHKCAPGAHTSVLTG